ncbi:unnamed protein product [Gadus morhua 'NCC']
MRALQERPSEGKVRLRIAPRPTDKQQHLMWTPQEAALRELQPSRALYRPSRTARDSSGPAMTTRDGAENKSKAHCPCRWSKKLLRWGQAGGARAHISGRCSARAQQGAGPLADPGPSRPASGAAQFFHTAAGFSGREKGSKTRQFDLWRMTAEENKEWNVLAKALFDQRGRVAGRAVLPEGDIMTVLERDTQGLDGWWLCSLHGRQGHRPRQPPQDPVHVHALGVLHADPSPSLPRQRVMMPPPHGAKPQPQSLYQIPSGPMGSAPQPPSKARELAQKQYHMHGQDIYQVPPSLGPVPSQGLSQGLPPTGMSGVGQDVYQVPRPWRRRAGIAPAFPMRARYS